MMSEIGNIHSVRIEAQSYLPDWRPTRPYKETYSARKDEGGVLLDLIHEIDYAAWLFGWPGSVHARLGNLGRLGIAAEEFAELIWETENGGIVSIRIDYLSKPPRREMRAYGDLGTLTWDGIGGTVNLQKAGNPDHFTQSSQLRNDMFAAQIQAFLDQEVDHRLATGEAGVKALAICDAARLSSETRHEETVTY
jgi:predicted dehydrogenase